jgi:uncharacterized membrane protein
MISLTAVLAICAMGLATYATRLSGFVLLAGFNPRGRLKAALDALPPAILIAVIAPTVLLTGPAETLSALITAAAAALRLPLAATILIGVVSVVLLRHILM